MWLSFRKKNCMCYTLNAGGQMRIKRGYNETGGAEVAAIMGTATNVVGGIVRLEPPEFQKIINRGDSLVVVHAKGGVFRPNFQYLTSYKGILFFTKAKSPLQLGHKAELITTKSISPYVG